MKCLEKHWSFLHSRVCDGVFFCAFLTIFSWGAIASEVVLYMSNVTGNESAENTSDPNLWNPGYKPPAGYYYQNGIYDGMPLYTNGGWSIWWQGGGSLDPPHWGQRYGAWGNNSCRAVRSSASTNPAGSYVLHRYDNHVVGSAGFTLEWMTLGTVTDSFTSVTNEINFRMGVADLTSYAFTSQWWMVRNPYSGAMMYISGSDPRFLSAFANGTTITTRFTGPEEWYQDGINVLGPGMMYLELGVGQKQNLYPVSGSNVPPPSAVTSNIAPSVTTNLLDYTSQFEQVRDAILWSSSNASWQSSVIMAGVVSNLMGAADRTDLRLSDLAGRFTLGSNWVVGVTSGPPHVDLTNDTDMSDVSTNVSDFESGSNFYGSHVSLTNAVATRNALISNVVVSFLLMTNYASAWDTNLIAGVDEILTESRTEVDVTFDLGNYFGKPISVPIKLGGDQWATVFPVVRGLMLCVLSVWFFWRAVRIILWSMDVIPDYRGD